MQQSDSFDGFDSRAAVFDRTARTELTKDELRRESAAQASRQRFLARLFIEQRLLMALAKRRVAEDVPMGRSSEDGPSRGGLMGGLVRSAQHGSVGRHGAVDAEQVAITQLDRFDDEAIAILERSDDVADAIQAMPGAVLEQTKPSSTKPPPTVPRLVLVDDEPSDDTE